MKKRVFWLAGCLMLAWVMAAPFAAEEAETSDEAVYETEEAETTDTVQENASVQRDYDCLVVGNTTHMNGDFFSDMWGNATSDLDVRKLLHGYNMVSWNYAAGRFETNPTVVSGFVAMENQEGDHIYQISLYDDLLYSDGSRISAWDYAFSILLQLSPQMKAIGARSNAPEYIQGADAWIQGSAKALSGVRVLNDYEMTITVDAAYLPYYYELGLLNFQPWPIKVIAPGVRVADDGEGIYLTNENENADEPVFTTGLLEQTILDPENGYRSHPSVVSGPYVLTDFDGETASFALNPYFKGDAEGALAQIPHLIYTAADNATMIDLLSDGTFDLLNKVSSADAVNRGIALTREDTAYTMSNYPRNGMSFVAFTASERMKEDAALRQAVAWCLDRDAIAAGYEENYGLPVQGYYGMGQWMLEMMGNNAEYPIEAEDEEEALAQAAQWEALSLDGLSTYTTGDPAQDITEAVRLLEEDGYVLNEQGEAFDPAVDRVRCAQKGDELTALHFVLAYPEGNAAGDLLEEHLVKPLAQAGVELELMPAAFSEILADFYGQASTGADMLYLATNFDEIFDPSKTFTEDEDGQKVWGGSGIADDTLYELAVDLRKTQPGDALSYCRKWVAFQERFTQTLPLIPIYSNVYFDFYTSSLQNYDPMKQVSWAQEILYSYYGDAPALPAEEESTEDELVFISE